MVAKKKPTLTVKTVGRDDVSAVLADLEGKRVVVCNTSLKFKRDGYHPAISLKGTLESHPDAPDCWRVVRGAESYAYFTSDDVMSIAMRDPVTIFVGWKIL